ncbi:BN860_11496g1_1 [Zygosaccharomyces bailii CLIB 213]|uniref:BN860_11496g1_1 n=1 Tax=Zygosaccharomyces bailii (strain CLIB 213 / ATCC 58445 / CBS 680 / BCRC 21525 / NBRC 1098 / NCYC 1416 / NRRL Y-2227) TaxID=1333698 RepID=A0A8J2SZC0_ZYGB2|nr:BN860_11496g1_1 [Zygosaccharomyces bailii CLIB 213]
MGSRRHSLLALSIFCCLAWADYVHKGCFEASGLNLKSLGQYTWQSVSYCEQHCDGSAIVALKNGGECLCGDSVDMLSSAQSGTCDVKCFGWPYATCGGKDSVDVYVDSSYSSISHSHASGSSSHVTLTSTTTSSQASSGSTLSTKGSPISSSSAESSSSSSFVPSSSITSTSSSSSASETVTSSAKSSSSSASSSVTSGSSTSASSSPIPSSSVISSSSYASSSAATTSSSISSQSSSTQPSSSLSQSSSVISSSSTSSSSMPSSGSSSAQSSTAMSSSSSTQSSSAMSSSSTEQESSSSFSLNSISSTSSTVLSQTSTYDSSFAVSHYSSTPTTSQAAAAAVVASNPATTTSDSSSISLTTSIGYITKVIPTYVTTGDKGREKTIYVTTTSVQVSSLAAVSNAYGKSANKKGSGMSGGAIAGVVVGVVVGVILIIACVLFFLWRRHLSHQEPDIEETKHYQPYSFGDADANPMAYPPSRNTSNWRKGSTTRSSSYGTVPTGFLSASNSGKGSLSSLLHSEDAGNNYSRQNLPSTVFEEPPSIYNGNQRFSTGSLPDMMQERSLRVANPDDEANRLSQRRFDDEDEDDEDNIFSAGSSGGSYIGQEPKYY